MLMYAHKVLWNFSAKCAELVLNLKSLEKKLLCPKKCELPQSLFISKLLKISFQIETRLMQLFSYLRVLTISTGHFTVCFLKCVNIDLSTHYEKNIFSKCVFATQVQIYRILKKTQIFKVRC